MHNCKIIMDWIPTKKMLTDGLTRGDTYHKHLVPKLPRSRSRKDKRSSRVFKATPHSDFAINSLVNILAKGLPKDWIQNPTFTSALEKKDPFAAKAKVLTPSPPLHSDFFSA